MASAHSKINPNVLLMLILLSGFLLRATGIQFGLPHFYHADEPIVVNHAMAYGTGDLNPHFFKIPPLVSYLLFISYGLYFLMGKLVGIFPSLQVFEYHFFVQPSAFYLIARFFFGVVTGTLSVAIFYRMILRHFNQRLALLASFFLAICFLHVRDSHYIYADIPLVFVSILFFDSLLQLLNNPDSKKLHVQAGLWIGLAAAIKYNGAVLIFPYLFTVLMARKAWGNYFLGLLFVPVLFLILNPFSLLDWQTFLAEIHAQSQSMSGAGWFHHFGYSLPEAAGRPMLFTSLAGLLLGIKRSPKTWPLAFFYGSYYLLLVFKGQPYDRYVLPMMPAMIFFAAYAIECLANRIVGAGFKPAPTLVYVALITIIAAPSIMKSILFDRIMLAKDTRDLAREWVETHIPSGSKMALDWDFYMPRLQFSRKQLETKMQRVQSDPHFSKAQERRLHYLLQARKEGGKEYDLHFLVRDPQSRQGRFLFAEPAIGYDLAALKEQGIQYVIRAWAYKNPDPAVEPFYQALAEEGQLLATFSPYRNPNQKLSLDGEALTGGPFLLKDLWLRERNGQTLEIYKLK